MREDIVDRYMTASVHTIAVTRTLEEAHQMMRSLLVRHLPVMKGGKLVGIVSQRDLSLIETLPGVDPKAVTVDDAMSEEIYSVNAGTPVADVARVMAARKLGSAVVMDQGALVGIFTATDALHALEHLLSSAEVQRALGAHKPAAKSGGASKGH
jgi:acetoin utilization protein AcuB